MKGAGQRRSNISVSSRALNAGHRVVWPRDATAVSPSFVLICSLVSKMDGAGNATSRCTPPQCARAKPMTALYVPAIRFPHRGLGQTSVDRPGAHHERTASGWLVRIVAGTKLSAIWTLCQPCATRFKTQARRLASSFLIGALVCR